MLLQPLRLLIIGVSMLASIVSYAQVYEMDDVDGQTINTCSGNFFDSQALFFAPDFYYDVDEDYTVTFCSPNPNDAIRFDFSFLSIIAGEDTLWAYDGATTAGPLLGVYSGGYATTSIIGFSGCITFVFKSTGNTVSTGWEAAISCFNVPPTPQQPSCTNIGFESGNFNGWYGTYGQPAAAIPATGPTAMSTGAPGAPTPNYFPDVYGTTLGPYQTITTGAGTDPYGGFPVVSPNGGTFSMRLGDLDNPYYGGASIEQKFDVTPANAMMIYSYAVVIQNALDSAGVPHLSEEQPYFEIEAFDCNGNPIPCGDFLVVGGPNIPGFTLSTVGADVYYKPWTDVFLDLTPYIGSCVTVKFTQGDCTLGAHFSYVYLDAICGPLEITGPQWICPGDSVTLEAPSGGASYLWSPGGETTQSISVSPASYTDYSCTITPVTGPACTTTLDYWVDVHPPASVTVNSDTVCNGDPVTLTAVPGIPGGTFSWSPGGQTTQSITLTPTVSTSDTVTYTDLNGCEAQDIATITVLPSPTPVITGTFSYCQGDSTQVSTTTPYPAYSWSNGATTQSTDVTIIDNPVIVTVTNNDGCMGSDTVTIIENTEIIYDQIQNICEGDSVLIHGVWESTPGTYSNTYVLPTGCDSTLNVTLVVNPLPVVDAGPDQAVCFGVPVTLTATGAPTINWDVPGVSNGNPFNPAVGTQNYIATGIDANGCSNTDTVQVIVHPLPTVDPVSDDVLCVDEMTNAVTFTGSLPGTTFSWTNDTPAIGLAAAGTGDIPSFVGLNPGNTPLVATITVTPNDGVCAGVAETFTITVHPLPNVDAGAPFTVCEGNQIILAGSGAATYVWNNGVVDGNLFTPTTGWYTVVGTDQYGCVNIDSVLITVEPLPEPSFTVDVSPCEPFVATLTNTTTGNITDCIWQINNGTTLTGCGPLTYTFPSSGSYDITLTTTTQSGCTGSVTYNDIVMLEDNPIAAFTPGTLTLSSLNTNVQFNNNSSGASTYEWTFGDGSTSTLVNPSHSFPDDESATYPVMLVAISDLGCTDTAYASIIVNEEVIFYVPNTFTPDNDDFNEYFQAIFSSGYDPYDFHLLIFDRWGEVIWESYDDSVGWNGTYGGKRVQDGTYTWKIEFKTTATDERIMVVGHVNVLR